MAEFNSCASLHSDETMKEPLVKYQELLAEGKDPFAYMLQMQFDLQVALAEKSPEHNPRPDELVTIGQKHSWLREAKQALDDEYRELLDALPGMSLSEKDRSAVWKRWKSKHNEIRDRTFDDLSEDDIKELKYEFVDMMHFIFAMFFALDMGSEELFAYYYFKNQANHERAKNGY